MLKVFDSNARIKNCNFKINSNFTDTKNKKSSLQSDFNFDGVTG